jgi:hypothetical protein
MVIMTKLLISGVIGVAVACLIFIGVVAPWSELAKSFFSPRVSPDTSTVPIADNTTLSVNLTISNFTEPLGLDSEADVTVKAISRKDMSNVEIRITLSPIYIGQGAWPNITWTPLGPQGIDIVDGNSTWIVNLTANVSTSFTTRIRATEVGLGVIVATAIWWDTPSTFYKSEAALYVQVLNNEIKVFNTSEAIGEAILISP